MFSNGYEVIVQICVCTQGALSYKMLNHLLHSEFMFAYRLCNCAVTQCTRCLSLLLIHIYHMQQNDQPKLSSQIVPFVLPMLWGG